MTQTLTHTGSGQCGANGIHRLKQHTHSQRKGLKIAQQSQKPQQSAAHNPEVVGSNPAPATRKPLESQDSGGFIVTVKSSGGLLECSYCEKISP